MNEHRTLDELDRDDCLRLLARHSFGRLAFMDHVGVLPMIIPVNYVLLGQVVTFRTGPGSKLGTATRGEAVAFEVDELDQALAVGWSVVVRGFAHLVTDPVDLATLQDAPLEPWAPGSRPHFVRIQPRRISGRRITVAQVPVRPA